MAKRLNISIPDNLFNRLKKFKGNFMVSKVCQEAITKTIEYEELRMATLNDDDLARRLKQEKKVSQQEYREAGFKLGVKDAYHLPYVNFKIIAANSGWDFDQFFDSELQKLGASATTLNEIPKYEEEIIGDTDTEHSDDLQLAFEEAIEMFFFGWIDGVISVWDKIKKSLR